MAVGAATAEREGRGDRVGLARLAQRAQPLALAQEQLLPVLPAFEGLLPEPGLRRGTITQVQGPAATSLALALLAASSAAGSWVAALGMGGLGLGAASELGIALERLLLVDVPDQRSWATAVAAAFDGVDAVLVDVPRRTRDGDARRLQARLRERGAVLVAVGTPGPFQPDVVVTGDTAVWHGLGNGWGHLRARSLSVAITGRRAAARRRTAQLWLPDAQGAVRLEETTAVADVRPLPVPDVSPRSDAAHAVAEAG
jgi:hypothetical protein